MDENELLESQMNLLSSFRPSQIFASFVFGVIGIYLFRYGKKTNNIKVILLSVLLMSFSMFTPSWIFDWGLGFLICGVSYLAIKDANLTG